ncbi:MAG: STAS-like domain-containing protein [Saprospiraceae bacterium]|nr:STAS-like domain-containing protein [Saprospiraceae bacterium]
MEVPGITSSGNRIHFAKMDSPFLVGTFLHSVYNLVEKQGYKEVIIDCLDVGRAFPNILVPIAGIVDYYSQKNIDFRFENLPSFLEKSRFYSPLVVSENQDLLQGNALNLVWRYETDSDTNALSTEILRSISQEVLCEEGVIDALLWCMNEIMDNVIVHSNTSSGFVMGQIHKQTRHIAFCVYDHGQGIFNSLKDSPHAPKNPLEAIQLAIQERVTRDKKVGQGNGMWGLSEIVKKNAGRLTIISGSGFYMRSNGDVKTGDYFNYLSPTNGACLVDFQLNYNKEISLAEALKGHKPVNYRTESFEDDSGAVAFRLADAKTGIGTRESGKRIRTDLINMFNDTKKGIIIDFDGLTVISSSFADELVGKMLVYFGFFGFNQIVRLKNMNQTIQAIVERSVAQRMAESFT